MGNRRIFALRNQKECGRSLKVRDTESAKREAKKISFILRRPEKLLTFASRKEDKRSREKLKIFYFANSKLLSTFANPKRRGLSTERRDAADNQMKKD